VGLSHADRCVPGCEITELAGALDQHERIGERTMRNGTIGILASLLLTCVGCATLEQSAITGGALGAMTGAIIGHQSGETAAGAGIGTAVGIVAGALAHDYTDHVRENAVEEYRMYHESRPSGYAWRSGTKSVDGHYEYETKRVWVDTSRDERVWVPEHYAGSRRIEGHWETRHISDGNWKAIEEKTWVPGY